MARVDWAHLCDYAFFDENRKVCIIGVFDCINVVRVPTTHTRAVLAVEFKGDPEEILESRVQVLRPDHGELLNTGGSIQLSSIGHAHLILGMDNLNLPDVGPYEIRLLVNGKISKIVPFEVRRVRK